MSHQDFRKIMQSRKNGAFETFCRTFVVIYMCTLVVILMRTFAVILMRTFVVIYGDLGLLGKSKIAVWGPKTGLLNLSLNHIPFSGSAYSYSGVKHIKNYSKTFENYTFLFSIYFNILDFSHFLIMGCMDLARHWVPGAVRVP